MKKVILCAAIIVLTHNFTFGLILGSLPHPQDDPQIRYQLSKREELKPAAGELWDLVENRICPLKRNGINDILGPALSGTPKDCVLPIYAPDSIALDGTGLPEFHSIGNIGYIQCYFRSRGDTNVLDQWALFSREDGDFISIKSVDDFEKRLKWDEDKLTQISRWLDEHLPKFKDLGIVDVSATSPTHIDLGNGKDCIVTVSVFTEPTSTNYWYHATVFSDETKSIRKPLIKADELIGFAADSDLYTATLRLTRSPLKDLGRVELLKNTPTTLELGSDLHCYLTARPRNEGGVSLSFQFPSGRFQTWVNESGDFLCFTTEGLVFRISPVLRLN